MIDDHLGSEIKAAFHAEVGADGIPESLRQHVLKHAVPSVGGGDRPRPRVRRISLAAALAAAVAVLVTAVALGVGLPHLPSHNNAAPPPVPSTSPSAGPTAPPSKSPAPVPSAVPAVGYASAGAAAAAGAQEGAASICTTNPFVSLSAAAVAVYRFDPTPCGRIPGPSLYVWVYRAGDLWYPYTWSDQVGGTLPTGSWSSEVPIDTAGGGCVNVHSSAGASAQTVRCLGGSDYVMPAAANHSPWYPPVWTGGAIWWFVLLDDPSRPGQTALGWIDADYLICGDGVHDLNTSCKQSASPNGYASAQAAGDAGARISGEVNDPRWYPGHNVVNGTGTGVFMYEAGPDGDGVHFRFLSYVYEQAGRWYPYTWVGTQEPNEPESQPATIQMRTGGGCVNLRSRPSGGASVLECLPALEWVVTSSPSVAWWQPPVWDGQAIWWYVAVTAPPNTAGSGSPGQPRGWVALQYLACGEGPHAENVACH